MALKEILRPDDNRFTVFLKIKADGRETEMRGTDEYTRQRETIQAESYIILRLI
jgi:hypothetical protein